MSNGMTEYHTVKQIDNSRLVGARCLRAVRDFWQRLAVGAALAACLLFYAWQHFESIQLRYQVEAARIAARASGGAEPAIAAGSGDAAFADARGRDCAESTGLDGSGAWANGSCRWASRCRVGGGATGSHSNRRP